MVCNTGDIFTGGSLYWKYGFQLYWVCPKIQLFQQKIIWKFTNRYFSFLISWGLSMNLNQNFLLLIKTFWCPLIMQESRADLLLTTTCDGIICPVRQAVVVVVADNIHFGSSDVHLVTWADLLLSISCSLYSLVHL